MRLVKLKLKNYRCYQSETTFHIDDLTAIIGKNDVGKSSLIESLDGFFNDNIDETDLSNNADSNSIELTCYFEEVPNEIILDTTSPTSPVKEGILNGHDQLEIKKTYTFGGRKTTAIFINANHPNDERLTDLLSMKNTRLKNYAEELGIDLDGVNKKKNPPIRQRIRESIRGDRSLREFKVDGNIDNENNLKSIWSSLKKLLPIFSLFKVDKPLDDKDGDIKDPMQVAINEALALPEIRMLLEQIENKVREASTEVADRTIEKLKDFDESLSERLKSDFKKTPTYNKIFDLTLLNENNIPLNKRGSGIRRLVLLSFFQAQAEARKSKASAPSIIYAIEEPETSQHPNHQKIVIDALTNLSLQQDVQVLFTTHSANLVREIPIGSLRYVSASENDPIEIEYGKNFGDGSDNNEVIEKIIKTLGILPNPSDWVKVIVYVEGNHDVNAIKRYSRLLSDNDPEVLDLTETRHIGYVITGGSALKHYLEHKHLEGLDKPEVHIYDNDVDEYRTAVNRINNEGNPRKKAFNTSKLELESYLHHEAVTEAYTANGLAGLTLAPFVDTDNVPILVAEAISQHNGNDWNSLDPERQKQLSSEKKKLLNTQAVEKMTLARLKARDSYNDLKLWLDTIKGYL